MSVPNTLSPSCSSPCPRHALRPVPALSSAPAPAVPPQTCRCSVKSGRYHHWCAGSPASVTNVGTDQDAVLEFVIPQGSEGPQGDKGRNRCCRVTGATGATGETGETGRQALWGRRGHRRNRSDGSRGHYQHRNRDNRRTGDPGGSH